MKRLLSIGAMVWAICVASMAPAYTDPFQVLHSFADGSLEPKYPTDTRVLIGSTLYGTSVLGGTNSEGTVYKLDTDSGDFTVLHAFSGTSDGDMPMGNFTVDGSTLYGVTYKGGASSAGVLYALAIPEPSTLVLLGVGAAGPLVYAWRRRFRHP